MSEGREIPLLLLTDDRDLIERIQEILTTGYLIAHFPSLEEHLDQIEQAPPRLVLLDGDAFSDPFIILRRLRQLSLEVRVILLSEGGDIRQAVTAIKLGAVDFLSKPVDPDQLQTSLRKALEQEEPLPFLKMDGVVDRIWFTSVSPTMQAFFQELQALVRADADLVILSEPGLDQEGTAKLIHDNTPWLARRRFISLDLDAFSHEASESLFWGTIQKILQEQDVRTLQSPAERSGTLFLANFGRLNTHFQESLLTFLHNRKERHYQGSVDREIRVIMGLVLEKAAMTEQLQQPVLPELLKVVIPPLRDRKEDLALLISQYVAQLSEQYGKTLPTITPCLLEDVTYYDWPGNIWELKNFLSLGLLNVGGEGVLGGGLADTQMLLKRQTTKSLASGRWDLQGVKRFFERDLLERFMKETKGDVERVAELLDLAKTVFERKLATLDLD